MKKLILSQLTATFLLSLLSISLYGQEKLNYQPSYDILVKGQQLIQDGEYEKGVEQLENVYEGDSLFFRHAVHMKMAGLNSLEEYEKVKEIGDKYWFFRHDLPTEFYLNYGTALDKLEEYDKAQEMYISILEEYPMNYSLWYNLGLSYSLEGDMKEAYSTFKKTIEVNPFYDRVHLGMARLAFAEQQTTKGLMAVGRYLLHSTTKRNNFAQLRYGDYMASSKYWKDDDFSGSNDLDLGGNSSYKTMDQLVHNYVALRDKYKTPSKLDVSLIKQLHLIASQLKEQGVNEDDYWYKTYGDLYVNMLEEDQFEGFSYLIAIHAENEKVKKIIDRKEKDYQASYTWITNYLTEKSDEVDLSFMDFGKTKVIRDNDHHFIKIIGDFEVLEDNSSVVGDIKFYNFSGRKSAEGTLNKNGNKDGVWKYYHPNGRLKEMERMEDGENLDTSYLYLPNGLLNLKIPYEDGKVNGTVLFYSNGVLEKTIPYKDGEIGSGDYVEYHPIGTVNIKYTIKDGKANGSFTSYYDSEEEYRKGNYEDGDMKGERLTYFRTGELSYKENFNEDRREGDYISYYRSGQVQSQGQYKEGNKIGKWEYFYQNGNKNKVQTFDERGKENGLETKYIKEGWKLSEHSYKKGIVDGYKFFNEDGEVISQGERRMGNLDYESYYLNGVKSSEGEYNRDGRNGEWKFYRYNGSLEKIIHYQDGKQVGTYEEYFPNEEVEVRYEFNEEGNAEGYYENLYRTSQHYQQGFLDSDNRDGPWRTYHRNGKLKNVKFYSDRNLQGFNTDYDMKERPTRSEYYVDGLAKFKIYYDTEGVAFDTIFQKPGKRTEKLYRCEDCPAYMTVDVFNNQYHGEQVFNYPNGTLEAKGEIYNGGREGPWKTYHPNGELASEGTYFSSNKHGEWKYYSEDGKIYRRSNYKYGDLHGAYINYDDDGNISFKANYSYDDLDGEVFYYVGNKQDHKRTYNYGYIETYTFINKNGEEVTKKMVNETADITTYWKNGKKAREFSIKNGWFNGPYIKYYENGQIARDQTYVDDQRNGSYKAYFPNGNIKIETQYEEDNIEGAYITYYENGQKKTESNYVLDVLEGEMKHYNKDGSLKMTVTYVNGNVIAIDKK